MLAFFALALFAHDEVRRAVWLSYISASYAGILPAFYTSDPTQAAAGWCCVAVLLSAPIMQFLTALMVLVSSLALAYECETQKSIATIILSNVALSFILELDNKVGLAVAVQDAAAAMSRPAADPDTALLCSTRLCSCGPMNVARMYGAVYMWLIGMLLLAEPVLLSPSLVRVVYGYLKMVNELKTTTKIGLPVGIRHVHLAPNTWLGEDYDRTTSWYAYEQMEHPEAGDAGLPGWLQGSWAKPMESVLSQQFMSLWIFSAVYAVTAAVFVVLLFGNLLPVPKAKRWGPVLLAVQVFLVVASTLLPSGLAVIVAPTLWFLAWIGMFVLWPLLHTERPKACCGCCGSCHHCSGHCPLCPDMCPGRCCCAC